MQGFRILVTYRDSIEETIPIDSVDVVIGLQANGVKPVEAKTDGRKLILTFVRSEAMVVFQSIQRAVAGVNIEPLMVDYVEVLKAKMNWQGLLTMMHSMPIQ